MLYVCRELNNDPLTDEQLRAILLKADSWLMYILQIWAGNRGDGD